MERARRKKPSSISKAVKAAVPTTTSPQPLSNLRNLAACLLIIAVVACLYRPVLKYSFTNYDDDYYVSDNTHIRGGFAWKTVSWAFTSIENANWHPLTWISHALDVQFFGLEPSGHHFTSLVLHALNSATLFLLGFYATGRRGPSLLLALLFAVHPINVESVAWIAERKNVLSTFFFLLTLGAYGWYARKPGWKLYMLVTVLFVCGLMSKPMLVTLPFVLLLLDYWPLERANAGFSTLIIEKIPLFALSIASSVITFIAQRAGQAFHPATQFPLSIRLENAIAAYALYLWKAAWPSHLAVFYPHPGTGISWWTLAASALALAAITGLVFSFRCRKYLTIGWLWFLGTLVPVIGIVQVGDQAMADRYAYVPFIGLFLMATWAGADLFRSLETSPIIGGATAVAVLLLLALTSIRQIECWSSNQELWLHALDVTPNNALAHTKVGWDLLASNDAERALPHLRRAVEISPFEAKNRVNLGICLDRLRQPYAAIAEYTKAIALTTDPEQLAASYTDLGAAYGEIGNFADAYESYDRSLRLNPEQFNVYLNRGLALEKQGRIEEAVADYERSVQIQPSTQAYLELNRVLLRLNRTAEAESFYEKAHQLASVSNRAH